MMYVRRFARNEGGVVAIAFGIALLPMIVMAGGAVDYSRALSMKARLQGVADAAALAAGSEALLGKNEGRQRKAALQLVDAGCNLATCGSSYKTSVTFNSDKIRVEIDADLATAFLGLIRIDEIDVGVVAEVSRSAPTASVYFQIDTSASMNIPFGDTAIAEFNALNRLDWYSNPDGTGDYWGQSNCSFACHVIADHQSRSNVAGFTVARANGIPLREDEVIARTRAVVQQLEDDYKGSVRVGIAQWGHNDLPWWEVIQPMTDDLDDVRRTLDGAIGGSSGTGLQSAIALMRDWIANDANDDAIKVAVLITDGMDDGATAMDPAFCDGVKADGVQLIVVNITYPEGSKIAGNADKVAEAEAARPAIAPALRACASSPKDYFEASDDTDFALKFGRLGDRLNEITQVYLAH